MLYFISGAISNDENYREKFKKAQAKLVAQGHRVLNPIWLDDDIAHLTHDEYLHIDFAMIDVAEGMYMLSDWKISDGANKEHAYGNKNGKFIRYEEDEVNIDSFIEKIKSIPLSKLPKLSKDIPIAYRLEGEEGNPIFVPIYEEGEE